MRIGFDISKAFGHRDGIGVFSAGLLGALVDVRRPDDELWLFDPLGTVDPAAPHVLEAPALAADGVELRAGGPSPGDGLDVFHANTWVQPPGLDAPTLFTCYDLTVLTHPECHTVHNALHCLTGVLEARLAGARFLAISEATAEALAGELEVPRESIEVIYPGVPGRFRPSQGAAERLEAQGIEGQGSYILAVGTLEPRKNMPRLLEAYGALPEALRRAHPLLLVGATGWGDSTQLDDLLARPELATVQRLGSVDDDTLVDLYSAATVFAYPSLAEGFGLPILEAMACHTPVLTSAGGATAEVAADAAVLVDPLDVAAISAGLAEILGDTARHDRLVDAGHRRAEDFSWRSTAEQVLDLYRRMLP